MARHCKKYRYGALQSMELLIVLPILALIGAGLFQFGMFFIEQQRLQSAVDAAARVAAQHRDEYASRQNAEAVFYETLGKVAWANRCDLDISVRLVEQAPVVVVEVKVPSTQVQPDLLGIVGLGLTDSDYMSARALMPCL
jgi:type II secretory pathway pseudopilin PulG